ncbi:MAG: hypothetical protein J0I34_00180 [Pseudonocardia sp.]|uniref:Rv1733c family protein n=1 Tax=unclassified Pseudonocardia TaxID=2619320 RepID=UPI00086F9F71|nr:MULTISPECIES: hypothetical protein [unclassified Pseudonocardia]MBN9107173.1 hypothetical protein [Pseudonocardia sp.]ODU26345.1 MAG: hypothetical protein ABS80_07250 [Pseudonocardia sp. SCN 72-51]ODV02681.1 MAG: hypothetical protein ABT15_24675 [Pseudonocardia sp. SCN 73-27]
MSTWLFCGLAAAVLVVTVVVAAWVHGEATDTMHRRAADLTPTAATTLSDEPAAPSDGGLASAYGGVRWTDSHGVDRTGYTEVPALTRAGTAITIWTDRQGDVVPPPPGPEFPPIVTAVSVLGLLVAGSGLLALLVWVERRWLARLRAAEWDAGWLRVEPRWSGREGSGTR